MMYPYLTLDDETEIVHSEMLGDNTVKVYIEKPDAADGFHSACCYLPTYERKDVCGFTREEISAYQTIIENNAHLILELSRNGGFDHASGFLDRLLPDIFSESHNHSSRGVTPRLFCLRIA